MNPQYNGNAQGNINLRLLSGLFALILVPVLVFAQAPQWWSKGVLIKDAQENNYAAVNQGQVKNITVNAVDELDAHLPGGAGEVLHGLVNNWSELNQDGTRTIKSGPSTNDYAAVNLGQLKAVATPFYNRLLGVGYRGHPLESGTYPWISGTANDYAMANIGQVKNLFSFDLTFDGDNPPNLIPDWWENYYFGHSGLAPHFSVSQTGLTISEAYQKHISPIDYAAGQAVRIGIIGGNAQSGAPQTCLSIPFHVLVSDTNGLPLPYAPVHFMPAVGGGAFSVDFGGTVNSPLDLRTDASGMAQAYFWLPSSAPGEIRIPVIAGTGAQIAEVDYQVTITDPTIAPTAPIDVVVKINGTGQVITWTDTSNNETGFSIERSSDNQTWSIVGGVPANITSYIDPSATTDQIYYYRVTSTGLSPVESNGVSTSKVASTEGRGDCDGDGMPDGWEIRNGLNPFNADDAYEDPKGDGYPNVYKYTHGVDLQSGAIPVPDLIVDQNAGENPPNGTFTTISAAITSLTQDYQIIQVLPGTYIESIFIGAHKAMLISRYGPEATTLQGSDWYSYCMTVSIDSVIHGFRISYKLSNNSGRGIKFDQQSSSAKAVISSCIFEDCSGSGYGGSALDFSEGWHGLVKNSIFLNNNSYYSGPLTTWSAYVDVSFCTFINNWPESISNWSADGSGAVNVVNSIMWSPDSTKQIACPASGFTANYCDISDKVAILYGQGNIKTDPLLSSEGRLTPNSPCRGIGKLEPLIPFDIDGEERSGVPDIGADQFVPISDNLPDWWKAKYFKTLNVAPDGDPDGDLISNLDEARNETDPTDFYNGLPPTIEKKSGDHQITSGNAWLPNPLVVLVSTNDRPVNNAPVRFEVITGQGGLAGSGTNSVASSAIVVRTGADGLARANVNVPSESGPDLLIHVSPGTGSFDNGVNFSIHLIATVPPMAPTDLSSSIQGNSLHISWTDNSDNEASFCVERSADGGGHWVEIANVEANETSYDDPGAFEEAFYIYRVSALNESGRSASLNTISIRGTDPETGDSDNDGMPDGWELRNGLNPLNPADANDNPSGDGYYNIYRYVHGMDLQAGTIPSPDVIVDPNAGPTPPSGTFTTISDAIAALTQDYQIIQVFPGVYHETLSLSSKKVMLISRDGPQSTIIRGGANSNVIECAVDLVMVGFSVCHEYGDQGGGIGFLDTYNDGAVKHAALIKCIISNCEQTNYFGAGLWFASSWHASVINCVFRNNHAENGGALGNSGANVYINDCTFLDNLASGDGQAIYNAAGEMQISNSIIWGAIGSQIAGDTARVKIDHSDVRGGSTVGTNIDIDPMLTNMGLLTNSSPCRGKGDATSASLLDIDGNPRGSAPDIGAYQFTLINGDLPDWWKTKYFQTTNVDPNIDSDGDGMSNLEEAQNGSDPTDIYNGIFPILEKTSGDNQAAVADSWLYEPLVVSISRSSGSVSGLPVRFEVADGNGGVALGINSPTSSSLTVTSGADGKVKVYIKCPSTSATNVVVQAIAENNSYCTRVIFTAHFASPLAPSGLFSTVQPFDYLEDCHLEWTDNSNNESGFVIERSSDGCETWTAINTVGANTTSFDDLGIEPWVFYTYRISAINAGGQSDFTNVVSNQGMCLDYSWDDSDGDGYPNIIEAFHGTNPYSEASIPTANLKVDASAGEGTYSSIQSAIDAAQQDYEIIEVNSGVYNETLSLSEHKLLLISSSGAATTIIDGQGAGPVISVSNDSAVFGFTIRNGLSDQNGGGILIQAGNSHFYNCVITGNKARNGAAMYCNGTGSILLNCTVFNNDISPTGLSGVSIACVSGSVNIFNSIIWNPAIPIELSGSGFNLSYNDIRGVDYSWDPRLKPDGHLLQDSNPPYCCNMDLAPKLDMDGEFRANSSGIGCDVYVDSDGNRIADWWEKKYYGKSGVNPISYARWDGLTILDAYTQDLDVANYYNSVSPEISIFSGDGQAAPLGDLVPLPFVVSVTDKDGHLLPNAPIVFHSAEGDLTLASVKNGTYAATQIVRTGADGTAQVFMRMPNYRGTALTVWATPEGVTWDGQATASVSIAPPLPPIISPHDKYLKSKRPIVLSSVAPGAIIYYTLDGSEPTANSFSVQSGGAVMISADCVLKAKVIDQYGEHSSITERDYAIIGQVVINSGVVYALRTDGSVWRWRQHTEYDWNAVDADVNPVQIQGLKDIVQIASGGQNTLALSAYGTVFKLTEDPWNGLPVQVMVNPQTPLINAVCVTADRNNRFHVVLSDGSVMYWGQDYVERDYNSGWYFSYKTHEYPIFVKGLSNVCDIKCGGSDLRDLPPSGGELYTALCKDGTVMTWGYNHPYYDDSGYREYLEPTQVNELSGIEYIAAGGNQSFAKNSDGTVQAWGVNDSDNPLGNISFPDIIYTAGPVITRPVPIPGAKSFIQVEPAGWSRYMTFSYGNDNVPSSGPTAGISADGHLWTWGHGYRGDGATFDLWHYVEEHTAMKMNPYLSNLVSVALAGERNYGIATAKDGSLWIWGNTGLPPTGINLIPVRLNFKIKNWQSSGSGNALTQSGGSGDGTTGSGNAGSTGESGSSQPSVSVSIISPENGITIP